MSNTVNITVNQGTSLPYTFTLTYLDNSVYNLTGYDARLQVRRTYGDTTWLINCTVANGKLVINAAAGTITWHIIPSDTMSIRFNNKDDDTLDCVYDLEITDPTGNIYKPAGGTLTINREVTR
ncbi:hypothetical protein [Sapientia aquatica]|uniref:BppU N-terminal domain-containing protein n=1 Tax=Sapientia aquatica TaxID=1549640 RepID=A0A4R5VYM7_9BURK|nr:hypothetical protein [Sapientia aquatica]TDK63561.1 hypothetical protein E2I14_15280 [Sapientia aquatica]